MLSKAQNKYIRSLTQQKFRKEYSVFIAEGEKIASEWLNSAAHIKMIVATEYWINVNNSLISKHSEATVHTVSESELQAISNLQTPNNVLLVVAAPKTEELPIMEEWCIALDNIQDPGNMGSIIRIADWFGIKYVIASANCVDFYNPKVVQAAMGGHLRVHLYETDLEQFIANSKAPILAATLDGENIMNIKKLKTAILLIGNESKGISPDLLKEKVRKITIPGKGGAESLNAAVSAGILCAMLMSS